MHKKVDAKTRFFLPIVAYNSAGATGPQTGNEDLLWLRISQRVHGGSLQNLWRTFEEIEPQHS